MVNSTPRGAAVVYDWNYRQVGRVVQMPVYAGSDDPRVLVVRLSEDAQERLRSEEPDLRIPMRYVYGVRRGEVTLDRSLDALARAPPAAGEARRA